MTTSLLGPGFASARIATSGAEIHFEHSGAAGKPPLLLLHGYPQTHVMWHRIAGRLARRFHVVCPDLRGYGDSSKPAGGPNHAAYAKREMARDMVELMSSLGHARFALAGHDRGARVAHRLCLDHPGQVTRACVIDILPTYAMYETADRDFATAYFHWFMLIQPAPLPERLIGADPEYWLTSRLAAWSAGNAAAFAPEAVAEYVRCFSDPAAIHASCEDYRAAAGIDLDHDEATIRMKVNCPLLVLWGARGFVGRHYEPLEAWALWAKHVEGGPLDCGHFAPEERPEETAQCLEEFFARG